MGADSVTTMQDLSIPVPGGEINVWHRPAAEGMPTAVLIHGLTGNSRWWSRVVQHLPEGLGVAAIDLRGRCCSVTAPPPFDLATLADDIAICLDRLGLDRATVVGYSMGAWITSIFATRHPHRVSRLLLLDGGLAAPAEPGADPDRIISAMVGPSLARLDLQFGDVEDFIDYWKAHPALKRHWDDEMRSALDHELRPAQTGQKVAINPDAIHQAARQITVDPETKDAAADIPVPTVLIVVERGTADQPGGMTPRHLAETAAASNPNLIVRYLEGLNHYTLVLGEGARSVADAIANG